jgi:hypothetical protein
VAIRVTRDIREHQDTQERLELQATLAIPERLEHRATLATREHRELLAILGIREQAEHQGTLDTLGLPATQALQERQELARQDTADIPACRDIAGQEQAVTVAYQAIAASRDNPAIRAAAVQAAAQTFGR